MTSPGPILLLGDAAAEVVSEVRPRLRAFNRSHLGEYEAEVVAAVERDERGFVGGATGAVSLEWLYVEMLFVREDARGAGVGGRLLRALEDAARQRGARGAYLDTAGFQAEGFYLRQGYREVGRIPGFARGWDRIYLAKEPLYRFPDEESPPIVGDAATENAVNVIR